MRVPPVSKLLVNPEDQLLVLKLLQLPLLLATAAKSWESFLSASNPW